MNEVPFDAPLTREQAAYELQKPVKAGWSLADALDRIGVCDPARSELIGLTGLTVALVERTWMAVQLSGGDKGALIYRLKLAAEASVNHPAPPRGESRRQWERDARAQTEARLREEQHAEQNRATLREQLEMISDQERARCVGVVLTRSPWLRRVCSSDDPLMSRLLGALVVNEWRRG